jgi:hypothetical protein
MENYYQIEKESQESGYTMLNKYRKVYQTSHWSEIKFMFPWAQYENEEIIKKNYVIKLDENQNIIDHLNISPNQK